MRVIADVDARIAEGIAGCQVSKIFLLTAFAVTGAAAFWLGYLLGNYRPLFGLGDDELTFT